MDIVSREDLIVWAATKVVKEIMVHGAYKATQYLNGQTVKATRKRYKGRPSKEAFDIVLTIGKPNYEEREKIKRAKKEGQTIDMTAKYLPKGKK